MCAHKLSQIKSRSKAKKGTTDVTDATSPSIPDGGRNTSKEKINELKMRLEENK